MDHHHTQHTSLPRWQGFIITLAFCTLLGAILWYYWPSLLMSTIKWQRDINGQLSDLLFEAKTNPAAIYALAGFSLLYGLLHALGPGHGKVIVTTYLATHPAKINVSLVITVLSALLQAAVAVLLVSILLIFFHASMREVNHSADQFIALSHVTVLLLGGYITCRALMQGWKALRGHHHHEHGAHCPCGHQHTADAATINHASRLREYIGITISIGIRPCTGAVLVLLFANMVDMYWLGIVCAILMAVGTAFTTSMIALMTLSGKALTAHYLNAQMPSHSWLHAGAKLIGGMVLTMLGLLLLSSQHYGLSPVLSSPL